MTTLCRHNFFKVSPHSLSKVIKDHFYAKNFLAHSFMDQFWSKFVWYHEDTIFTWNYIYSEMSLLYYGEVL